MFSEGLTTNTQLTHWAAKYSIPLRAIVSKDQLYFQPLKQGGYIINMQDSREGAGTHWVAIWLDEDRHNPTCYFDSFGIDPPLAIIDFMRQWNKKFIISDKEIQNINSGFCGQYSLYFLYWMSRNSHIPLKKRYALFERLWS